MDFLLDFNHNHFCLVQADVALQTFLHLVKDHGKSRKTVESVLRLHLFYICFTHPQDCVFTPFSCVFRSFSTTSTSSRLNEAILACSNGRKGGQCISAAEVHAESRKGCIKSLLAPSLAPFLGAHKQTMNSYLFLYLTFTFLHRSCSCSQDLSLVAAGAEDGHLLAIFSLSIEALTPPCLKTEQRPERHYDKFLLQLLTLNVCIIFYSRLSLWTSELTTRSSHSKWKPLNAECINMLSLSLQLRAVAARTCHEG